MHPQGEQTKILKQWEYFSGPTEAAISTSSPVPKSFTGLSSNKMCAYNKT